MLPTVIHNEEREEFYAFRRLQLSNQETDRQKKNTLQMCLIFDQRARSIQKAGIPQRPWSQNISWSSSVCFGLRKEHLQAFFPVSLLPIKRQEDENYGDSKEDYKAAFLKAVEEYNNFGVACTQAKLRIDDSLALSLLGFKAGAITTCQTV